MSPPLLPTSPLPLLGLVVGASLSASVCASSTAPSNLPSVDYSRMGNVGLAGAFSGLDWYTSSSSSLSTTTSAYSSDGDTVVLRGSDGSLTVLGSTNAGGIISSLCWSNSSITSTDSTANGTLYIGGTFSSISSLSTSNIVAYSLTSNSFHALGSGLTGPVNALYCDNANSEIWVGGQFPSTTLSSTGANVALWSTYSQSWQTVGFGGLDGTVDTISSSSDGKSLYFGGEFTTAFSSSNTSIIVINGTMGMGNVTSIISAPGNTTTTGNSGYLTPFTFNNNQVTVSAGPSTNQSQYANPDVILCPGTGTWLAADDQEAAIDITSTGRLYGAGIRVANGLVEGRATNTFCVTSLPDETLLNMTYTDPATGKNTTCWYDCPLSYQVTAQDYIFTDGPRNMSGLHIVLHTWTGAGSAIDWFQLLTDGAYASAISANNEAKCGANSSVSTTGSWTSTNQGNTSYLTSSSTSASVTISPYVASAGYYNVYLQIPGCASLGDCSKRTTVDVEIFPLQSGTGWTSLVNEAVQNDTDILIYTGPVDASSSSFNPMINLSTSAAPSGSDIVASGVQLVLIGVSSNSSSSSSSSNSTSPSNSTLSSINTRVAYGVYEYQRNAIVNADSILANTTETSLTQLGFTLDAILNSSSSANTVNAITSLNSIIYVGGEFQSAGNFFNVLAVGTTGAVSPLDSQGLNGIVYAAATVGSYVYFGGAFTSTATGGTRLSYLARYDPSAKAWAPLGDGVDGIVTGLTVSSTDLIVSGNYSNILASNGTSFSSGGYAVYDTKVSDWSSSGGVVYGNVSAVAVTSSSSSFFAGRVAGSSDNSVEGVAMLQTGSNGATISSLPGVSFSTTTDSTNSSTRRRRSNPSSSSPSHSWLTRIGHGIFDRSITTNNNPSLHTRVTAPTISSQPADAPAVLAGAFWSNTSQSGVPSVTILGGNFSSGSSIRSVAFYSSGKLTGTSGTVNGVVKALDVAGNDLYIGGENVNVVNGGSGVVVYNMLSGSWVSIPSLSSNATVNTIKTRMNTNTLVIAGDFTSAGTINCPSLCLFDTSSGQWSAPGSGLSSGEVRAIDFAGSTYDTLIAAGSFVLSSGTVAYVASYSFDNSSWTALGSSLPGPALAVAVDNLNASNIFAAGYSTSDGSSYLQQWDGSTWTAQNGSLLTGSVVQQLAFVPMKTAHTAEGLIEDDRMLMVSGDLYLKDQGNVTTALFDGAHWYPYLVGTSSSGSLGSASQLFWSQSAFSFGIVHHLARGLVVLVAIAIATGLILLLILLILLATCLIRRVERNRPQPDFYEKDGSEVSSTHQHVFNNVQAALEQSLAGGAVTGVSAIGNGKGQRTSGGPRQSGYSGDSEYAPEHPDADVGLVGAAAMPYRDDSDSAEGDLEDDEQGRETTMRYDFDGPDLQPGEMSMRAGQRVVVLDDEQSDEWWYARDPATGREGVVPATYVW